MVAFWHAAQAPINARHDQPELTLRNEGRASGRAVANFIGANAANAEETVLTV
jgi:hypothetical protein